MDLAGPNFFNSPPVVFGGHNAGQSTKKLSPLGDSYEDPLCNLALRETSEFVKSLPMAINTTTEWRRGGSNGGVPSRRLTESPATPGRPVFSFSSSVAKKGIPSKWDDAEKWLISSHSCNESPAHNDAVKPSAYLEYLKLQNKRGEILDGKVDVFAEKSRVTDEKVSLERGGSGASLFNTGSTHYGDTLLKDKFTDESVRGVTNFRYPETFHEGFFRNSVRDAMGQGEIGFHPCANHRDIGTEMTPLGSSTTSRCNTPLKDSSPSRHNTPSQSGPLALEHLNSVKNHIDITQLTECHLAKLHLGSQYDSAISNWGTREEEEDDVSKSLRHCETGTDCSRSDYDSRYSSWDKGQSKCCLRYQREEAKIQSWVNLQHAKAEAQSKKLEVKILRMRSKLEEKLMKRMALVKKKAEERMAAARQEHTELIQKSKQHSDYISCSCLPCNRQY